MTEVQKYILVGDLPKGSLEHHPDPLSLICLNELLMKWKDTPWTKIEELKKAHLSNQKAV